MEDRGYPPFTCSSCGKGHGHTVVRTKHSSLGGWVLCRAHVSEPSSELLHARPRHTRQRWVLPASPQLGIVSMAQSFTNNILYY